MTELGQPFVLESTCRAVSGTHEGRYAKSLLLFFLSILFLHLDSRLSKESSNHQKIGDINEALQIFKQPTQTASA